MIAGELEHADAVAAILQSPEDRDDIESLVAHVVIFDRPIKCVMATLFYGPHASLDRLQTEMRDLPDRGAAAFKRIAGATADPDVQIIAATAILPLDEPFGMTLLQQIVDADVGIASFTVKMTPREWRSGGMQKYRS